MNFIKKISLFIPVLGMAFSSNNPYITYKSLDSHRIIKLNYVFQDYYDCYEKKPDMVVEELTEEMLMKHKYSRKGLEFRPDYNLPKYCRSYPSNYSRTGFDRGHNAPNYDWAWNRKYQKETFLMSNITPQTPSLNRYLWKTIEGFSRYVTKKFGKAYIYTGSFGFKGYIKNNVVVPKYWYKIILIPKTKDAFIFVCENKKYPRKHYGYKDIQNYLYTFNEFKNLNKDFKLDIKGKWYFNKAIDFKSGIRITADDKEIKGLFKSLFK